MPSYNHVALMGNLTRDVEMRYTPKGAAVANFSIAINRNYTNDAGQKMEDVTYVEITAWQKLAEIAAKYLKKGSPVFINGRLQLEQWDDKQTGQKRSKLSVVAEGIQFLPNAGKSDDSDGGGVSDDNPFG